MYSQVLLLTGTPMLPAYLVLAKMYDEGLCGEIQRVLDDIERPYCSLYEVVNFIVSPDTNRQFMFDITIKFVDEETSLHTIVVKPDFLYTIIIKDVEDRINSFAAIDMVRKMLHTEYSMAKALKLEYDIPLSTYGDLIEIKEFIDCCEGGGFIDYDGNGLPVLDNKMGDYRIKPSQRKYIPEDCTHIMWYNR